MLVNDKRIFLSQDPPWANWDAVDGYIDCETLEEKRVKFWGYALAGVRCWATFGLDGWSSNDHLRDRMPVARDTGRAFVVAVRNWRDQDLALQRQRESEDRVRELVTEALNTVYDRLGEHAQHMAPAELEALVVDVAREYVRICYDYADPMEV